MYEIAHRDLTPDEARRMRRAGGLGFEGRVEDFVIAPVIGCGGTIVLGIFVSAGIGWVVQRMQWADPATVIWPVLALATAAGLVIGFRMVRDLHRSRKVGRKDVREGRVEVIRVEGARLVEREPWGDEGPIYYLGLGEAKVLLLAGQWLYGGDGVFGDADAADEEEPPFPAAEFTIHRLPRSGQVLSIEIKGPRLPAEAVIGHKTRLPSWALPSDLGNSFLLSGDFDELVRASAAPARPGDPA